ncbi:MAG: hypothetical protein QW478_01710 [Candidatus Micrarchaeaceae archaeon]
MGKSTTFAFAAYDNLQPYTFPASVSTGSTLIPVASVPCLIMKAKKNFELMTYQISATPGVTYQSDYLLYTGCVPVVVLINISTSLSLTTSGTPTPTPINVQYVAYKGENGQFPCIPIPSIQMNLTLTPGVNSDASATGIVCLNPGDTLTLYNSTSGSTTGALVVNDFMVTVTKIKTISCKNKSK